MPTLPPKPEIPAVVAQVLVAAALSTGGCAPVAPRIGQPPPVRIGAEQLPEPTQDSSCVTLQIVDEQGAPLTRAQLLHRNGDRFTVDADGRAVVVPGDVKIVHAGFVGQLVNVDCGETVVELVRVAPTPAQTRPGPITKEPVRIGVHPGD